jgi:phosphinothricin acetyltransferase
MTAPITVGLLREADLARACAIVNHYIANTTVIFHTESQTPEEWRNTWQPLRERYPWLTAVRDGAGAEVVGVAYATPWRTRNAYDWSVEVTVYVADEACGQGIGRALYRRLLDILDAQGYQTMGSIALPNPASVALHESLGFEQVGILRSVGFKLGRWCDVGIWQRRNPAEKAVPGRILPVSSV